MDKIGHKMAGLLLLVMPLACLAELPDSPASNGLLIALLSGSATPETSNVQSLYSNSFNSYLENDGVTRLEPSGAVCDTSVEGGYSNCVHASLLKRITVSNYTSCSSISASDSLNMLLWGCDDSSGTVQVYSLGFIPGQGVSTAIDFTTATWKSMYVTVTAGSISANTDEFEPWDNTINKDYTDASADLNLNDSGTVYIFTTSPGKPIRINNPNITVLTDGSFEYDAGGTASPVIQNTGPNFSWIENFRIKGSSGSNAINFQNTKFNMVQLIQIDTGNNDQIFLNNSHNNVFQFMRLTGWAAVNGVETSGSRGNLFYYMRLSNGGGAGFQLDASSDNNVFMFNIVHNTLNGIQFNNSSGNTIAASTIANLNGGYGVLLDNNSNNNYLLNNVISNATQGLRMISNSSRNVIFNLAATHNDTGILLSNSSHNVFFGLIKMGAGTLSCNVSGGTRPGITSAACAKEVIVPPTPSLYAELGGQDISTSFIGQVTSDDINNTGDSSGSSVCNSISDSLKFDNFNRGWGLAGGTFLSVGDRGPSAGAGTCRILDFNLLSSDSIIRNVFAGPGDGNNVYPVFRKANNQTTCQAIPGAVWAGPNVCDLPGYFTSATCTHVNVGGDFTTVNKCVHVTAMNSVEVLGDSAGNENGLCESNELCLRLPNYGAYQGHGTWTNLGKLTDGIVTNVRMYEFSSNGY